jgi:hypothetical protein
MARFTTIITTTPSTKGIKVHVHVPTLLVGYLLLLQSNFSESRRPHLLNVGRGRQSLPERHFT